MDDGEEFNPGVVAKLEGVRVVQVSAVTRLHSQTLAASTAGESSG